MMGRLRVEGGFRNMARKRGRREKVKLSLGSNQGPLTAMRDGCSGKVNLSLGGIIWFL